MISKILKILWTILIKIPRLKDRFYSFYAWKIFEIVPTFKYIIYKFYDKFWYFELFLDLNNQTLLKSMPNKLNIDSTRLNYYIENNTYLLNKDFNFSNKWDDPCNLKKIEESQELLFLKEHFIEKKKWEDIEQYKVLNNNLSQYNINNSNRNFFFNLINTLDQLYYNFDFEKIKNKIRVGIGSKGEFILIDGIFYVSLLRIRNEKIIPIEVIFRHPKWVQFSNEFLKFQAIHGDIYQPLIHPDLSLKTGNYSDERFRIIKDNLEINTGTMLDIGANLGFFCHNFEDLGFTCYAVEIRPINIYFMKKLREIEGKKFKIINKSIFDLEITKEFDVVIALNIFHHFLREKKLYFELIEFLKKIKMKTMFFQPHNPNEKVMQNAYINYNNSDFVDFIIKNSCLNKAILLNDNINGKNRPIYKLVKIG